MACLFLICFCELDYTLSNIFVVHKNIDSHADNYQITQKAVNIWYLTEKYKAPNCRKQALRVVKNGDIFGGSERIGFGYKDLRNKGTGSAGNKGDKLRQCREAEVCNSGWN